MSGEERLINQQVLLESARQGADDDLGRLLQEVRFHLLILAQTQMDGRIKGRVSPSDVVQDTLLEAHRDFGGFRGETIGEFLSWLRVVLARNLARMVEKHVVAKKRGVHQEISLESVHAGVERSAVRLQNILATQEASPSALLCNQERLLALSAALAELPNDYRQVIILRHIECESFAEIANRMGRTAGACRMLWFRAIDSLRQKLGDS